MDLQSLLGYSDGSPFSSNPYLDIHTPEGYIDMSNTSIDILGVDNKGNKKKMKAGRKNPYKFEGSVVREIPMQRGGNIYEQGGGYDFLFGSDDEDEAPVTAPSTDEVPDNRVNEGFDNNDDEYNATLAMAMQTYNDPFVSRQEYKAIPHGAIDSNESQVINDAANRYGVPANLLTGVYGAETSFGSNINQSSAGAQGAFQFMPATAKQYGVDVSDFSSSANGAAHYLKDLYNQFGNWEQAVAAYNAGPGNIKKGRYPEETRKYVPKVFGYANSLK